MISQLLGHYLLDGVGVSSSESPRVIWINLINQTNLRLAVGRLGGGRRWGAVRRGSWREIVYNVFLHYHPMTVQRAINAVCGV